MTARARPERRGPTILVGSPETFARLERRLSLSGRPVVRISPTTVHPEPLDRLRHQLERVRRGTTTVVVTSRQGVRLFLRPLRRELAGVEVVSAGPATSAAARAAGFREVRAGHSLGALGVREALRHGPRRRIVYARSDRAGPGLARELRADGHDVTEIIAYRIVSAVLRPSEWSWVAHPFTAVIASPSALSELRRSMSHSDFRRFRAHARPVVLGTRTARASRGHGLRDVHVVGPDLTWVSDGRRGRRPSAVGMVDGHG